jgi:hypothetical protein
MGQYHKLVNLDKREDSGDYRFGRSGIPKNPIAGKDFYDAYVKHNG